MNVSINLCVRASSETKRDKNHHQLSGHKKFCTVVVAEFSRKSIADFVVRRRCGVHVALTILDRTGRYCIIEPGCTCNCIRELGYMWNSSNRLCLPLIFGDPGILRIPESLTSLFLLFLTHTSFSRSLLDNEIARKFRLRSETQSHRGLQ